MHKKRKLDVFAEMWCAGDTHLAIEYILDGDRHLEKYVDEFTEEEAQFTFGILVDSEAESTPSLEIMKAEIIDELKFRRQCAAVNMTEPEIRHTTSNPFTKKIFVYAGLLVATIVLTGFLTFVFLSFNDALRNVFAGITILFTFSDVFMIFKLVTSINQTSNFKKAKKNAEARSKRFEE